MGRVWSEPDDRSDRASGRYWTPGLGRSATDDWDIEGGHFAERFQAFIIIALGESIVVTGATASQGLSGSVVAALIVAFVGTGALWWLYFGEVAEHSRKHLAAAEDPGRLGRDAYTYLHLPITAGIIMVAVADDLLLKHPGRPLATAGVVMTAGGPALYLFGETLFRLRMIGPVSPKRVGAVIMLARLRRARVPRLGPCSGVSRHGRAHVALRGGVRARGLGAHRR